MPEFDIVFEKLELALQEAGSPLVVVGATPSPAELDEIDELRRFSAEIQEAEPLSFTTT